MQAFPRKIGEVRWVSEKHGYCNVAYRFACCIYGISALGVADTHSQLCIAIISIGTSRQQEMFFNWLAHPACAHTFGEFSSQMGK